jgi:cell division topological specificity factor
MSIISRLFGVKRPQTATVAKERLQIVLAHERARRDAPDFLPVMQHELLMVVAKYFHVQDDMIKIQVEKLGETSVLEINVELDKARVKGRDEVAAKETSSASEA